MISGLSKEYIDRIGNVWNKRVNDKTRNAWWDSEQLIRHINYLISGEELQGWNAGAIRKLKEIRGTYEKKKKKRDLIKKIFFFLVGGLEVKKCSYLNRE